MKVYRDQLDKGTGRAWPEVRVAAAGQEEILAHYSESRVSLQARLVGEALSPRLAAVSQ